MAVKAFMKVAGGCYVQQRSIKQIIRNPLRVLDSMRQITPAKNWHIFQPIKSAYSCSKHRKPKSIGAVTINQHHSCRFPVSENGPSHINEPQPFVLFITCCDNLQAGINEFLPQYFNRGGINTV
jgi:hypothetical protein